MHRVALIGANGQVGAELCLMLAAQGGLELMPICRTRSGSAFLRWHGIACRHGRIAEDADAERLLSDCDVVVNSSLAGGTPAQIRRTEARIVRNIFHHSKDSATIIHFSTQSVYGDPTPRRWIRWRTPYGRAKLATERQVRRQSRRTGKRCYILRLGHVCGALQEISAAIRAAIRDRNVILPAEDRSSNTVYTAAIVGAIEQIMAGSVAPGTYDLMNTPRWSWREVYEFEAAAAGVALHARTIETRTDRARAVLRSMGRLAGELAASQAVRDLAAKLFAHVPEALNARATAWWYVRRARSDIARLSPAQHLEAHLSWVENGRRFFPAERSTIDLLRASSARFDPPASPAAWAADAPDSRPALAAEPLAPAASR